MVIFDKLFDEFFDLNDQKEIMVGILSGRYLYAHEHAVLAFKYSEYLRSRWIPGESAIAKNQTWAYFYAIEILKSRFFEGEPAIASNTVWLNLYEIEFNLKLVDGRFVPCK